MSQEKEQFLRGWSVLSKTADEIQVARYEDTIYVFVEGFPIRQKDFAAFSLRATFGKTIQMSKAEWVKLNELAMQDWKGLAFTYAPDVAALKVVEALARHYGMTSSNYIPSDVYQKMTSIEQKMKVLKTEGAT